MELSGAVVKSSNICVLLVGGMEYPQRLGISHVPERELGSKM
jgi:hypothetical protein